MASPAAKNGGVSIRAYARARGCSEAAVRKRLKTGALSGAVLADGKIDVAKADRAWTRTATRGPSLTSDGALARSTRRRLRAHCRALGFKVNTLRQSLLPAIGVTCFADDCIRMVEEVFTPLPAVLAPRLAGRAATHAAAILQAGIHAALEQATDRLENSAKAIATSAPFSDPALERLSEAGLSALKNELAAQRIELLDQRQRGALLDSGQVRVAFLDGFLRARGKLMYLHGKLAPRFVGLSTAETEWLLRGEFREALRTTRDWPSRIGRDTSKDEDW